MPEAGGVPAYKQPPPLASDAFVDSFGALVLSMGERKGGKKWRFT
jgi:hypothetical protein